MGGRGTLQLLQHKPDKHISNCPHHRWNPLLCGLPLFSVAVDSIWFSNQWTDEVEETGAMVGDDLHALSGNCLASVHAWIMKYTYIIGCVTSMAVQLYWLCHSHGRRLTTGVGQLSVNSDWVCSSIHYVGEYRNREMHIVHIVATHNYLLCPVWALSPPISSLNSYSPADCLRGAKSNMPCFNFMRMCTLSCFDTD